MKTILNQINRYSDQEFTPGSPFAIILDPINNHTESQNLNSLFEDDNLYVKPNKMQINGNYKVTVKKYMTEPSSDVFDFQDKWNNGIPMPLVTMVGKVLKETRGMYLMELTGKAEATSNCIHCGRKLTNKISMMYGIGPQCGEHFYINPFDTEEELEAAWQDIKEKISNIKWRGWVIKSAIKEWEEV